MEILEGEKAIGYLERVRSCIISDDGFSHLVLIAAMLDIEISYFKYLAQIHGNDPLLKLTIDSSGFPELEPWKRDIRQAILVQEQITARRAKTLLPFLEQLKNASLPGIADSSKLLAHQLSRDYQFTSCLSNIQGDKKAFLLQNPPYDREPTIYNDQAHEGLLLASNQISPFQPGLYFHPSDEILATDHKIYIGAPPTIGFKFVDCTDPSEFKRPPFIICAFFESEYRRRKTFYRILVPGNSITQRTYCHNGSSYDLDKPVLLDSLGQNILEEYKWQFIDHRVMKTLFSMDACSLADAGWDTIFNALNSFNCLIRDSGWLIEKSLTGEAIAEEGLAEQLHKIQESLALTFYQLPDDAAKLAFQVNLAEFVRPIEQEVKKAAFAQKDPEQSGICQGVKKQGGRFWWIPRLPRLRLGAGGKDAGNEDRRRELAKLFLKWGASHKTAVDGIEAIEQAWGPLDEEDAGDYNPPKGI